MEFANVAPYVHPDTLPLQVFTKLKVKGIPIERVVVICTKSVTPKELMDEMVPFILEMLQVCPTF